MKCGKCGLVLDRTTYDMDIAEWKKVNGEHHGSYQGTDEAFDDPKWKERLTAQSILFAQLFQQGVFPSNMKIVDYGCGDGKLSDFFRDEYERIMHPRGDEPLIPQIKKYDKYMKRDSDIDYLSDEAIYPGAFDAVITCSVFEHLRGKENVEDILGLLNEDGVFCLHTLVCEEVPKDPDWYYLVPPVHCTFWTNKAMSLVYKAHDFKGCAYNVEARMWFFFKNREMYYHLKDNHNKIDGTWAFSEQFVDYWKQKPYR